MQKRTSSQSQPKKKVRTNNSASEKSTSWKIPLPRAHCAPWFFLTCVPRPDSPSISSASVIREHRARPENIIPPRLTRDEWELCKIYAGRKKRKKKQLLMISSVTLRKIKIWPSARKQAHSFALNGFLLPDVFRKSGNFCCLTEPREAQTAFETIKMMPVKWKKDMEIYNDKLNVPPPSLVVSDRASHLATFYDREGKKVPIEAELFRKLLWKGTLQKLTFANVTSYKYPQRRTFMAVFWMFISTTVMSCKLIHDVASV